MDVSIKLSISRLKWYEKSVLGIFSNVGIQNSFKIRKKPRNTAIFSRGLFTIPKGDESYLSCVTHFHPRTAIVVCTSSLVVIFQDYGI